MRRSPLLLVITVLALTLAPTVARADGDPPSDFLLSQDTFVPLKSAPTSDRAKALERAVRGANGGIALKVAVIGRSVDLGTAGELWLRQAQYATFLRREIAYGFTGTLLVVMPSGFGTAGPKAAEVLRIAKGAARVHGNDSGNQLTDAALAATRAIAEANPSKGSNSSGSASRTSGVRIAIELVLATMLVMGLAVAGHAAARRSRRRMAAPGVEDDSADISNGRD